MRPTVTTRLRMLTTSRLASSPSSTPDGLPLLRAAAAMADTSMAGEPRGGRRFPTAVAGLQHGQFGRRRTPLGPTLRPAPAGGGGGAPPGCTHRTRRFLLAWWLSWPPRRRPPCTWWLSSSCAPARGTPLTCPPRLLPWRGSRATAPASLADTAVLGAPVAPAVSRTPGGDTCWVLAAGVGRRASVRCC